MLRTFTEYRNTMERELAALSHWQRVAYALVICQRFRPHYETFHRVSDFGDPTALVDIEQALATELQRIPVPVEKLAELQIRAEAVIPDEEVLERVEYSPSAMLAQDAAIVHINALGILAKGLVYVVEGTARHHDELEHAWWLANYCYDAADREAADHALPDGGVLTQEIEAQVEESTPIRREIAWQRSLIAELRHLQGPEVAESGLSRYAGEPLVGRIPAA